MLRKLALAVAPITGGIVAIALFRTSGSASHIAVRPPAVVSPMNRHSQGAATASCSQGGGGSRNFDSTTTFTTTNVEIFGSGNYADAAQAGAFEGADNYVCDDDSVIAGGFSNLIDSGKGSNGTSAALSFIAAGSTNYSSATMNFIGSGAFNTATKPFAFVGAGYANNATGPGSFVGAGDYAIYSKSMSGQTAAGTDSMIGAGDLNQIASTGNGSFIGGGGFYEASSGVNVGNKISSYDSFDGAGDGNSISSYQSFVGSGMSNSVTDSAAFIGAGIQNTVSGTGSFVGAGSNNETSAKASFIGGGILNRIGTGDTDSFVGAGDGNTVSNTEAFVGSGKGNLAAADNSFVGAGSYNEASGSASFVGAGEANEASAVYSFIGGGEQNTVGRSDDGAFIGGGKNNVIAGSAPFSTIVGGDSNTIGARYASILGGVNNAVSGAYGTIVGGESNSAFGAMSFAGGYHASASHSGSFVWSDYVSKSSTVSDTSANQFVVRASGGTKIFSSEAATSGVVLAAGSGSWSSASDRNLKVEVAPLDDDVILAKVATLPVDSWQYRTERGVRHLGPMAQDFYQAFGVGEDDRHISAVDEDGIALAAIKALHSENLRLRHRLSDVEANNMVTTRRLNEEMRRLDAEFAALRRQLSIKNRSF